MSWPISSDERRAVVASIVGCIIDDATDAKTKGSLADWLLKADAQNFAHAPPKSETEDDDEPQEPPRESEDWRVLLNERNRNAEQ